MHGPRSVSPNEKGICIRPTRGRGLVVGKLSEGIEPAKPLQRPPAARFVAEIKLKPVSPSAWNRNAAGSCM
jgi:hypothetical protein